MNAQILSKDGLKLVNLNRRKAIHERCLNCVGWYSHDVNECDFGECPLQPFRAGAGKHDTSVPTDAVRRYCLWCMCGQKGEVSSCPASVFVQNNGDRL